MKYAFILSILSLVLYHDIFLSAAGVLGYAAGIFFLFTYREKPAILAIGCISTIVITLMYFSWDFSFEGYMHIGIAWSMTITAFVVILTLVSLIMKIKDILVK
ncbi:hypothetical protein [uncultured Dialister sp.]|uniref:hypothetical protein n=1 Tax=uncultured Dialister sp. TaxID=278064 RepID=UPI0025D54FFC|nr:hypothetical protein [uncultured Dialister sp.]